VVAPEADRVAVLSSTGRLLVYPLADLPIMSKGKGNKLIQLEAGERVVALCSVSPNASLQLLAGSRGLTLKPSDLAHYSGKRGARGHLLPRGYQKASAMQMSL
ncbi:MAG: DNA gyrase C-terminal beta-propeller domain-containing protein, partial [Pseudomonadota bacterium]|nr:DNA gyrase C-terminal beta-propeller domain-containing protein [Pseudomonadota bacterium]